MTTLVDSRGVDALAGQLEAQLLPAVIWGQIVDELGPVPEAPHIDPFDGGPWRELPQIEELSYLWVESPIVEIIHNLAIAAHENSHGTDFMEFMTRQRWLAQLEVDLARERQAQDAAGSGVDDRTAGEVAAVASAAAGGGGGDVSGGSEDGGAVGEVGEAAVGADGRRTSKVPRGRRVKAASGA